MILKTRAYVADVLAQVSVMGRLRVARARDPHLACWAVVDLVDHRARAQADHHSWMLGMLCASLSDTGMTYRLLRGKMLRYEALTEEMGGR